MNDDPSAKDPKSYLAPEISKLGMQALQVYQRQHAIADRLWAQFNKYSGLMILLALLSVTFRKEAVIKDMKLAIVLIPLIAYLIFLIANHAALRTAINELAYLKGVAIAQTRMELENITPETSLSLHALMAVLTMIIYSVSWLYVLYWAS
jgi:hypothetical protein